MRKICVIIAAMMILAAFATASCAFWGKGDKAGLKTFQKCVELFNTAMRWGDYQAASELVFPLKKQQFWSLAELIKKSVRITEVTVRDASVSKTETTGTAIVTVQYYRLNSAVLKDAVIREEWVFSPEEKVWRIRDAGSNDIEEIN